MNAVNQRTSMVVSGTVQGVFFRASTLEMAQSLNLTGWVKNLVDGQVEIVAEGPSRALEDLIKWCHHGPPEADVTDVTVHWEAATDEFGRFRVA